MLHLLLFYTIKILTVVIVLGVIGYVALLAAYFVKSTNDLQNKSAANQFTDLLLSNAEQRDVPQDPKTGDAYFPGLKIYIPASYIAHTRLASTSAPADNGNSYVTVSNAYTLRNITGRMYSSSTIDELFTQVPKYQACSRGIALTYDKSDIDTDQNKLVATLPLANGKTLYEYLDKGCPELTTVADALKNLRSY